MASTATTRLRLEKQALGENSATWGAPKLNTVLDLVDEAIGGVESVAIAGATTTLTSTNYASDQSRNAALVLTGTLAAASEIIVPNVEKLYLAVNNTTGSYSLTIKTAAGTGYALRSGPNWVYCDAVNVSGAVPRLDQAPLATASVDVNSQRVTNLGTPSASTDAATKAYVDAAVSTTPTQNLATSAGTALAPTYSWATDSNTGLYLVGSDSLGLSAGGTVRATVSSTGLAVAGVLSASGAMTASAGMAVTGTLSATGAATLGSTLGVTGALTAASVASSGAVSGTTLSASGATTLSSTLGVTGAATLSGALSVTGSVTASSTVTAAGVILGPAGSVGAPSHSFSGDTNTGIRNSAADTLAIVTGGADRFSVDSAGIVRATGDLYWETGTNRNIGYASLVDHAAGNIGVTTFGVEDGGGWTGMVMTNSRVGSVNSQSIEFKTAEGGISTATTRLAVTKDGYVEVGQTSTVTPGYSGNTTQGSAIYPDGRHFISQPTFSNWNQNADGTLLSICRSGTAVGSIAVTTTTTSFNTSSDYRLKTGVEAMTGAVARLATLQPRRFRFKAQPENAPKTDGFLAHELASVVPSAVTGSKDGPAIQQVDLSKLVPLLVGAVQELAVRVTAAEAAIKTKKDK